MTATDASNAQDASVEISTSPTDINFTPTAAQAGRTTVTIRPDSNNGFCTPATTATLTLTYATDTTGQLTAGKAASVKLSFEGQNADYKFTGATNHHVTVVVTKPHTSPAGSCLGIAAVNASNATYASTVFSTSPTDINFAPTEKGPVTVVVFPSNDNGFCTPASSATFDLTYAPDVTGKLTAGKTIKVDLKYEGQNAVYNFTAVAHRKVSFAVKNPVTSPAGSCLGMSVVNASNFTYGSTVFSTQPTTLTVTPTESGPATLQVFPSSNNGFCTPASSGTFNLTYR
jgi:hypothetical protein